VIFFLAKFVGYSTGVSSISSYGAKLRVLIRKSFWPRARCLVEKGARSNKEDNAKDYGSSRANALGFFSVVPLIDPEALLKQSKVVAFPLRSRPRPYSGRSERICCVRPKSDRDS